MDEVNEKPLTRQQQKALHKLFDMVSQEFVNNGITMQMLLEEVHDIPVTPHLIKEVWREMQYKMLGKLSTRNLSTKDVDTVFEPFGMMVARLGIEVNFPSIDEIMLRTLK